MQSAIPYALTHNPTPKIERSVFDRSCGYKTTFNAGYLIPFFVDEILPGDTFNLQCTIFARMATPIFPLMDNLFLDTQYFFIPSRLLWDDFKAMMGEQADPSDDITAYTVPVFDRTTYPATGFAEGSIYDYLGLPILIAPPGGTMAFDLISLPCRAYNLIWNQWYRDQNLQNPVAFDSSNASDDYADYVIKRRGKRKDYFTSALLTAQKLMGQSVPTLPYNTSYSGIETVDYAHNNTNPWLLKKASDGATYFGPNTLSVAGGTGALEVVAANTLQMDPRGNLQVAIDPANFMGTINDLRVSVQLQRFMEADNRGGTRYPELVWNHFGVITPDLLWRPEYLGGSSDQVRLTPVQQTSESNTTPQGNLAATGMVTAHPRWVKSFTEHGYIMGLCSVRADMNYQQNVERMWIRQTRYDFYWPTFAHLGEQPVYLIELFSSTATWSNNLTGFGFQERYAEYRFKNSLITGKFRSQATTSLDAWHLAQEFSSSPALNSTFIEENPPVDRVVAVTTEPQFILDSYTKLSCARPMPVQSIPGMMDHF